MIYSILHYFLCNVFQKFSTVLTGIIQEVGNSIYTIISLWSHDLTKRLFGSNSYPMCWKMYVTNVFIGRTKKKKCTSSSTTFTFAFKHRGQYLRSLSTLCLAFTCLLYNSPLKIDLSDVAHQRCLHMSRSSKIGLSVIIHKSCLHMSYFFKAWPVSYYATLSSRSTGRLDINMQSANKEESLLLKSMKRKICLGRAKPIFHSKFLKKKGRKCFLGLVCVYWFLWKLRAFPLFLGELFYACANIRKHHLPPGRCFSRCDFSNVVVFEMKQKTMHSI